MRLASSPLTSLTRLTPLAAAATLALAGSCLPAFAQQAAAPDSPPTAPVEPAKDNKTAEPPAERVEVTGIRASRQQSMSIKRQADSVVEVISAEDIGKMPDKNVADALQRLPGVQIGAAAAGEGGFSENDRVSIRGTSPSLTLTTINGHMIGTGDWYVQAQTDTEGRSVSYALLPSEIVSRATVHKSPQADLIDGGVSGLVDIETRHPLDLKNSFTAEASLQGIYSDLAAKSDPQMNAIFGWKNEAKNFGVLLQVFSETRHERRDGQEFLGYSAIEGTVDDQGNPDGMQQVINAHPDLAGVLFANQINQSLFQQTRKRTGGLFDLQAKPLDNLTLDLNAFRSHLAATNYDTSFLADTLNLINHGIAPTAYTVRNNTLVAATFPTTTLYTDPHTTDPSDPVHPATIDKIYRPGASSETWFVDANFDWRVSDALKISGSGGVTRGRGDSSGGDIGYENAIGNAGLTFATHGVSRPADVAFPGTDVADYTQSSNLGAWFNIIHVIDKEKYAKVDTEWAVDSGIFESLKFGARYASHTRELHFPLSGGCGWEGPGGCGAADGSVVPWHGELYPSNYGHDLGVGSGWLKGMWQLDPNEVKNYVYAHNTQAPVPYWPGELSVYEKTGAAYGMLNLNGDHWRGNVGLRVVDTHQVSHFNEAIDDGDITPEHPFGTFQPITVTHNYIDLLPSASIRYEISKDLISHMSVGKTISRPDYTALAGAITSLDDLDLTGTGGNADLKPVRSTNFDATLEWYYAPKAMVSVGVFYMEMPSYITFGTHKQLAYSRTAKAFVPFTITSPVNIGAHNEGIEFSWQAPVWGNFGMAFNYGYVNGKDANGDPLLGNTRNTYNLEAYYENDSFNARVALTHRSDTLVAIDRGSKEVDAANNNLAFSAGYKWNDHLSFTFDALNLNNPVLHTYADHKDMPRSFYSNGRQFYLGVRVSL